MAAAQKLKFTEWLGLLLLVVSGLMLIGLQIKIVGWILWLLGLVFLLLAKGEVRKYLILLYFSLALLAVTEINTDTSGEHMLAMGIALILAVSLPYLVVKYIYRSKVISFPWHHGRKWFKSEIFYIFFTAIIAYLLLPFYLENTGAYLNWTVEPGAYNIFKLFIGTNALGIWDELFFVGTVYAIFRQYLSANVANFFQAILFTSFLYELGFTGWGWIMILIFALIQGYIFQKTESLLYIITIHLTLDFILFLALINAHHPDWLPIFLT